MMKGLCKCLVVVLFAWSAAAFGADEDVEQIFSHYVKLGEELAPVLASAKDADGARDAAPALQALLPRVMDSGRELRSISALNGADLKQIRAKFERPMRETWGRVYDEIYRLQRVRCYECVPFFRSFSILCSLLEE